MAFIIHHHKRFFFSLRCFCSCQASNVECRHQRRVKVTPVETLFREPLTAEQTSKHRSHAYLFTGTYKCGEHHHDHNKALLIAQRRNNQNVLKKKQREKEVARLVFFPQSEFVACPASVILTSTMSRVLQN